MKGGHGEKGTRGITNDEVALLSRNPAFAPYLIHNPEFGLGKRSLW
ncbi:hypothetical protein [Calothrix sp. UHCC 0171]|nr:hypothetical protein [Calothrix sp. UHCC 0171]MEA5571815.1 hypothetical protein [Calothrix sp. UHCC 0171]